MANILAPHDLPLPGPRGKPAPTVHVVHHVASYDAPSIHTPGAPPPNQQYPGSASNGSLTAAQMADAQLAPQLTAQSSSAQYQNEAIKAFALQLLGKLQGVAPQVQGDYE